MPGKLMPECLDLSLQVARDPCNLKAELQTWHRCVRGLLVRSSGFSLHWVRAAWRL